MLLFFIIIHIYIFLQILYGDLAARNILFAEDNVVKVCDFGLAKTMYKDGNYTKKSNDPMLIKWMAIESIRDGILINIILINSNIIN